MFVNIVDFARNLLAKSPTVALITWKKRSALMGVVQRLGGALRRQRKDTTVLQLIGAELDSEAFSRKLLDSLTKKNSSRLCLFIHEIEPLATAASKILNGFRERFAAIRALVIFIREDRRRDLLLGCPDLMDWVGLNVARAEDLGRPFTIREVSQALRKLEGHYDLSSKEFAKKWSENQAQGIADAWLWRELLAVRADLLKAKTP